jgi:hypothetical protein
MRKNMKAQVEWKDGDAWKQATVEMKSSRAGNTYFVHVGMVYVLASLREGSEVVTKGANGKWVKAGRVTRGSVFLGEGLSWGETNEQKWEAPIFQ